MAILAAILYPPGTEIDGLLVEVARKIAEAGGRVGGVVQGRGADGKGLALTDLGSGAVRPISQNLGPLSTSCKLDTSAMAEIAGDLERQIDTLREKSRTVFGQSDIAAFSDPDRVEALLRRRDMLNARRYRALRFRGPGTDLCVGLADGHAWMGGASPAKNGISGNPNIPTEEVFTTPHARRVEGHVSSTKPLSYQGSLIDEIQVRYPNPGM